MYDAVARRECSVMRKAPPDGVDEGGGRSAVAVRDASAPETFPSNVLVNEQILRISPTIPGRSDISRTSV